MSSFGFKVNNDIESRIAQEILFTLGYQWMAVGKVYIDTVASDYTYPMLIVYHPTYRCVARSRVDSLTRDVTIMSFSDFISEQDLTFLYLGGSFEDIVITPIQEYTNENYNL